MENDKYINSKTIMVDFTLVCLASGKNVVDLHNHANSF